MTSGHPRTIVVDDQLDVPLEDSELLAEMELTTDLIIAATESDAAMGQAEIDALLGVRRSGIPTQKSPRA